MLQRANDDLRDSTLQHQEEVEEWKASTERQTSSLSQKDNEITALSEKLEEAQEKVRPCEYYNIDLETVCHIGDPQIGAQFNGSEWMLLNTLWWAVFASN